MPILIKRSWKTSKMTNKPKAILFDRYFDTLGGGERYLLTVALALISHGYDVEIAWENRQNLIAAEKRFGFDLNKIKLNADAFDLFFIKSDLLTRYRFTKNYDLIFWISDGTIPLLFSKKNLIHFQVPFTQLGGNIFFNQIKSAFVYKYIYNSKFTEEIIERQLHSGKGIVLYPPIATKEFSNHTAKEKLILSVARFDSPSHAKRQDVLIHAFSLLNKKAPDYQLILAGGQMGDEKQLNDYQRQAKGLPVKFLISPDFEKLKNLYAKAKFFWHAAGFEINEAVEPEKTEHFGMTTVEAMAAGCVPVVIGKGGQKEILADGSGVLCQTAENIASETLKLINDRDQYEKIRAKAIKRAGVFDQDNFTSDLAKIL